MRPHMAHIQNTMIKKQLAERAGDKKSSYQKYRQLADKALASGYDQEAIIKELQDEQERIRKDIRAGDSLFLQGVKNAQVACIASIDVVIDELKGVPSGRR